jgi:hypothetical protein
MLPQPALNGGAELDFSCAAHIKWSPRLQPHRAADVMRQLRDILDRTGLSKIIYKPMPTEDLFRMMAAAQGMTNVDTEVAYQALSHVGDHSAR